MDASLGTPVVPRLIAFAAASLVLAVIGTTYWSHRQAHADLLGIPTQERQSLYEHTLEALRTTCTRTIGEDLAQYCREQAQFVSQFPECDASCLALCRKYAPKPTK
jgi:hypothetical protein